MTLVEQVGMIASIALPLWNIPLMINMVRRKSSADLSWVWLVGVWVCSFLMLPSGIASKEIVLKMFSIVNITLFTGVVVVAFKYRKKP